MKKLLQLILALVLTFASLSLLACDGSGDGANVITILGKKSDMEKSYMTKIIELYEQSSNNKVKVIKINDSEFETEAKRRYDENDEPDILMHFHNADLNAFKEDNFYLLDNESWVSDLMPSAEAYCRDSSGNLLGLPFWESSVSGCYYNKTLLDKYSFRPAHNQEKFDDLCELLKGVNVTPICWPSKESWMYQFPLDPVFADHPDNLERLNKNELSYKDIPDVLNMAEWLQNASQKGWFGDDYLNIGWNDIPKKLASGETAMTFIWDTWFYTDFKDYIEKNPSKYGINDFELMPVFMNTVDGGTYEDGNLNMMMVSKNSDKLQLALEFLRFCATPENYNAAFDGIATVSCFKGQNTNIQSHMVLNAQKDIAEKERISTASTKIIGYSAQEVAETFNKMFRNGKDSQGNTIDPRRCVELLDELRINNAKLLGVAGF